MGLGARASCVASAVLCCSKEQKAYPAVVPYTIFPRDTSFGG